MLIQEAAVIFFILENLDGKNLAGFMGNLM